MRCSLIQHLLAGHSHDRAPYMTILNALFCRPFADIILRAVTCFLALCILSLLGEWYDCPPKSIYFACNSNFMSFSSSFSCNLSQHSPFIDLCNIFEVTSFSKNDIPIWEVCLELTVYRISTEYTLISSVIIFGHRIVYMWG